MKNSKEIYKKNSKDTFNKQAENYDDTFYGKHAHALYDGVIEKIEKFNSKSVLDVGCGTGNILLALSKNQSIDLYGVDLSEEMLNAARKKLYNKATLKLGDSENLPWEDETFESVICTDSFHHYPHPENVIIEMARVLKRKGKLIIGDPWAPVPLRQIMNFACRYSKDGDYKIYCESEIRELLTRYGFNNIEWERVNSRSFIVTAESNK